MSDTRRQILKYLKYKTGHADAIQHIITLLNKRSISVQFCAAANLNELFMDGCYNHIGSILVSDKLGLDYTLYVLAHEAGHAMEKNSRWVRNYFSDYLGKVKLKTIHEMATESKEYVLAALAADPCRSPGEVRTQMRREFVASINQDCEERADRFAFRLIRLLMKNKKSIWRNAI